MDKRSNNQHLNLSNSNNFETKYKELFDTMVSGFALLEMIYDEKGTAIDCRYIEANPAHEELTRLKTSDIIGRTAKECIPHLEDSWINDYALVAKTGVPMKIENYVEGLGKWYRASAYRPKEGFVAVTFEDITESKELSLKLIAEKDRLSHYLAIAGVMLILLETDGTVSSINQKGCEILGYDEKDIVGKNWFDNFLYAKDVEQVKEVFLLVTNNEVSTVEYFENPIKTKNGERYILWHNSIVRDKDDNVLRVLSSGEDVTRIKELTERIEKQALMFNSAFKLSPIATFLVGSDGVIMDANQKAEKMLEVPKSYIIGMNFLDITHPSDHVESVKCVDRAKATGIPQSIVKKYITPYGKETLCDTTVNYIEKNGDSYFVVQSADITERQAIKNKVLDTLECIKEISLRNS